MNIEEELKIINDSYNEVCKKYNPIMDAPDDIKEFNESSGNLYFGDFFLYQIINGYGDDKGKMTYPKLGLFIKYLPCDQTVELEFIDCERTWMCNQKYICNPERGLTTWIDNRQTTIQSHIEWDDQMYVFGVWKSKPTWKQLKPAYQRSIWYYRGKDHYRDSQINKII